MIRQRRLNLSVERLREVISYDPTTGIFEWKGDNHGNRRHGDIAGHLDKRRGIRQIYIDGILYLAHRLAWLYFYGQWPEDQIDHINCNPSDNRICNLRESTQAENTRNTRIAKNNSSGYKGVSRHPNTTKWRARITYLRVEYHLGLFDTAEEAYAAYCAAAKRLHKEFARFK